jgi:hypothetical protein
MSTDAEITHRVAVEMRSQLAQLVGPDDWPTVADELARLDAAWDTAGDNARLRLAADYRDALAPWPEAYEQLQAVALSTSLVPAALLTAAIVAAALGDVSGAHDLRERAKAGEQRLIVESGPGRPAYSIKLSNLEFYFWELSSAAGDALSAVDTLTDPAARPFALAGAVLTLIGRLSRVIVQPIAVDDASVFLGLVEAAGEGRQAYLAQIIAATNERRTKVYLEPLTEAQVKRSLAVLNGLRSIAPVGDVPDFWRVVEEHGRV